MLRQEINDFLNIPIYSREHNEGWKLLQLSKTCEQRILDGIKKDNDFSNSKLERLLLDALDSIQDEHTVPEELKVAYVETPSEVIDLYKEQTDLKGRQSALHARLAYLPSQEERRLAASEIVEWQKQIDSIWADIHYWKTSFQLPSERAAIENLASEINNKKSLISKTRRKIREKPEHRLVNTWEIKITKLEKELAELKKRRDGEGTA